MVTAQEDLYKLLLEVNNWMIALRLTMFNNLLGFAILSFIVVVIGSIINFYIIYAVPFFHGLIDLVEPIQNVVLRVFIVISPLPLVLAIVLSVYASRKTRGKSYTLLGITLGTLAGLCIMTWLTIEFMYWLTT
ncbi:hypothetical protein J4526_01415 [Desulfurococcaceae archaeon MEX13E-LK6-19]|nr:hypothetical protein J4526_01415 [Desulfurococcaceae archaeon MEX13E-LK6-19]